MAIYQQVVSFGLGAKKDLFAELVNTTDPFTPAHLIVVQNDGLGTIYLGGATVTTPDGGAPGLVLKPGKDFRISLNNPDRLWGANGAAQPADAIRVLIVLE